ncbi:platelet glycoprotein 4 [Xylocopa sonorina]|uniref:platelet glycoprotein 4 n=1 Tax=Xylocopa sonorina TaxID=1818115 RepID=UPI00403B082C
MKFTVPLQQFRKCMFLFIMGIICSALAYIINVVNPVKLIVDSKLKMTPGSLLFELWKQPPIDVFLKVYIFNITNAEEFLQGGVNLKVEEVGPYVYKEVVMNENVTWNMSNNTISYYPKRNVLYMPELSVGDPLKDIVSVPNIPMLGLTSTLHDAGFFVNYPWSQLLNMLDSKPILSISVHDYLWGYEDRLIRLASAIVPRFINFHKFGLLDRLYDEGNNLVVMYVGHNENMTDEEGRYLSIQSYNGSPGMKHWGYREEEGNDTYPENTICNRIKGCTEGEIFPRNLDKHAVFRVYRKTFCRTVPIIFQEEITLENGLNGYLYKFPDNFLDPPDENPENACYCYNKKKCLKKGLSDMSPCYYNIPAALSLPHFIYANSNLADKIDGLNPDPEKHATRVVLEPLTGIPLNVNSRMQVNLVTEHTIYTSRTKVFNDMTIPLFWTDLEIPMLSSNLLLLVKLVIHIAPVTQIVIMWLLAVAGVLMCLLSIPAMLRTINQQQESPLSLERRDSCDLRIPLNYGQYTTMHILPAIKKITSRTDIFS